MNKNLSKLFAYRTDLDIKSAQFLMKALESNNLPGFDYIEYKQALGALLAMNMDEGTAFKSSFATASTMGLTRQKLVDSAKHYMQILEKEKGQFDVALRNRIQQRVGAKEEENNRLEGRYTQIQEQMKRLEEELVQIKTRIEKNNELRENEAKKLVAQKENFESTYDKIQEEITKDLNKITTYL